MWIDRTDDRFKIDANHDVIEFIRRLNPFAHSDVGMRLLKSAEGLDDCYDYSPSYPSYAYVVLHNKDNRIFAIAHGQRGLSFHLPDDSLADAYATGAKPDRDLGPGWVAFDPWGSHLPPATDAVPYLQHWCKIAFEASQ